MTKNEFIYACITGHAIAGRDAGAENDGWRERPSLDEAAGYHNVVEYGDAGTKLQAELEACEGEFNAATVAAMLDEAKEE